MRRVIGITGGMGSGKTSLARRAWCILDDAGLMPRLLLVDNLRYSLLCGDAWMPDQVEAKQNLSRELGVALQDDGTFWFPAISEAILHSPESLETFRRVTCPALVRAAREKIDEYEVPVLLEGSALLQEGFASLLDNPLVLLCCDDEERHRRIAIRDADRLSAHQIRQRLEREPTIEEHEELAARLGMQFERLDSTFRTRDENAMAIAALFGLSQSPAP